MNRNGIVWGLLMLIVTVSIIVYSTYFSRLSRVPDDQEMGTVKLDCWIYTNGWEALLDQFQRQHPDVDLNVRVFRSYKDLFEALQAAVSAHTSPHIVELENSFGLSELVGEGALKAVSDSGSISGQSPDMTTAFTFENGLWAVPAGLSLPVLLYNQELVRWAGLGGSLVFGDLGALGSTVKTMAADLSERNIPVIWQHGLGVDEKDIPFLFMNVWGDAGQEPDLFRLQSVLEMWSGLVHDSAVLNPLHHRLAASDFITGKMLFYISGSERMREFDRYIAGKFGYGLLSLPGAEDGGLIPRISAFAQMAGQSNGYAEQLLRFLASKETQMQVLEATGYMPVRGDVQDEMRDDATLPDKYRMLLQWEKSAVGAPPSADDRTRTERITDAIRTIELEPDAEKLELAKQLLPYWP